MSRTQPRVHSKLPSSRPLTHASYRSLSQFLTISPKKATRKHHPSVDGQRDQFEAEPKGVRSREEKFVKPAETFAETRSLVFQIRTYVYALSAVKIYTYTQLTFFKVCLYVLSRKRTARFFSFFFFLILYRPDAVH